MNIVSRKMIKPSIPTPQNLKEYKISLCDELMPPTNTSLIFFYSSPPPPPPHTPNHHYPNGHDLSTRTIIDNMELSLANILPRFYPLAGRYIRKEKLVHCNDQGVEFVEAIACSDSFKNVFEYVQSGAREKPNDALLPRLPCEVEQVTDPMVSIQVTRFGCGGIAIGLSVSQRIFDGYSVATFARAWAEEANNKNSPYINPSFDSPALLPFKNLFPGSENTQLRRTMDPNIIAKRFVFGKDAIETLKDKARDRSGSRRVSSGNVVTALISKALIRMNRLKKPLKNLYIAQAVSIRDKTVPPFPEHSCGNLFTAAKLKLRLNGDDDDVGVEDLVPLLRDALDRTISDCASIFSGSDEGLSVLYRSEIDMRRAAMSSGGESKILCFSDGTKFGLYEADFGWGKPIWVTMGTAPADNLVFLFGNREGDRIEAVVNLVKEDMALFEQDEDIIIWLSTKSSGSLVSKL